MLLEEGGVEVYVRAPGRDCCDVSFISTSISNYLGMWIAVPLVAVAVDECMEPVSYQAEDEVHCGSGSCSLEKGAVQSVVYPVLGLGVQNY